MASAAAALIALAWACMVGLTCSVCFKQKQGGNACCRVSIAILAYFVYPGSRPSARMGVDRLGGLPGRATAFFGLGLMLATVSELVNWVIASASLPAICEWFADTHAAWLNGTRAGFRRGLRGAFDMSSYPSLVAGA